jgi:hypothetical protein
MDSYKHSCPFCGQHIEYTVEYCGKQVVCPACGKSVTFPAVLPGGKGSGLHLKRPTAVRAAKWSFNLSSILASLREFEHWNMVLVCLVPFILVTALVVGAGVVKKKAGEGPAMPVAPRIQADPNAWQTMTNLARADQLVQQQLRQVALASVATATADRNRATLHAYYQGRSVSQTIGSTVANQFKAADQVVTKAQTDLAAARQSFDTALQNYQTLGGTVDYRRQLPQ